MELTGYEYVCSAGETFDQIALDVYGNERYASALMNANPEQMWKTVMEGNERLRIPVVENVPEDSSATSPYTAPWKN